MLILGLLQVFSMFYFNWFILLFILFFLHCDIFKAITSAKNKTIIIINIIALWNFHDNYLNMSVCALIFFSSLLNVIFINV